MKTTIWIDIQVTIVDNIPAITDWGMRGNNGEQPTIETFNAFLIGAKDVINKLKYTDLCPLTQSKPVDNNTASPSVAAPLPPAQ